MRHYDLEEKWVKMGANSTKGRPGTGLSLLASLRPASHSAGWAQTDRSIPAAADVGKQLALKKKRFLKRAVQEKGKGRLLVGDQQLLNAFDQHKLGETNNS